MGGARHQLAVDVGGTFTDLVLWDVERDVVLTRKQLTTPEDPSRGIFSGIDGLMAEARIEGRDVGRFVHATTLVANAILERKGARTALVATSGFRDVLEIRRELRYDLFEQHLEFPEPLVPRARRLTLDERMDARGVPRRAPSNASVAAVLDQLEESEAESVAVCLLHAYANPAHEELLARAIRERLPAVTVSLSSDVLPQIREYERTSATVINAYVQPVVQRYLGTLASGLAERGCAASVLVMTSTGGVVADRTAGNLPLLLIESGPAAGALIAARLSARAGERDLVAFDMGGTTAKICVIENGRPLVSNDHEVARAARFKTGSGMPVAVPVFDLLEIGAGGGSIARVDATGLVRVGPESASAHPGPACYGTGGQRPTVTDANLILGYLGGDVTFGGRRLDEAAARRALQEHIGDPTGTDAVEAAASVHRIVTETMAEALRVRAVEHNVDLRGRALVSFGGAAGLHAVGIAARLGIRRVICPPRTGVFSAAGLLVAPLAVDAAETWIAPLAQLDVDQIRSRFARLTRRATAELATAGVKPIRHSHSLEMSYVGQEFEIDVPLPSLPLETAEVDGLAVLFGDRYERLRGRRLEGYDTRVVTWRARVAADEPPLSDGLLGADGDAADPEDTRQIRLGDRWHEARILLWEAIASGDPMPGPLLVQHRDTALLVPPGAAVHGDGLRRLIVDLEGGSEHAG